MKEQIHGGRPGRFQWRYTFAALRHPNYRLWFWGQMVSLFGTWMQSTAQGFLVFELTRSPAYLGYVSFASGVSIWLFMLFGGVIADRIPRRTLLLVTQSYMMVLALVLAALTFLHWAQPWHILVMAFLLGVGNAFDAPARQAFVLEMVSREDLTNAIALNSAMFNASMAVGPAAGGLLYAFLGPGWCFTINGLSFLAVIASLLRMRLPAAAAPRRGASTFSELSSEMKAGVRYTATHPQIRVLIGLAAGVAAFGFCFVPLFPAWAVHVLGGDAVTNGWLQSARGAGALVGSLTIASLGRSTARGRILTAGSILFPLLLLVYSFTRHLPSSLLLVMTVGFGSVVTLNLINSLVQTLSSDGLRGRVMSLYSLAIFGLMPVGGLLAGTAAQRFGEPAAVAACALLMLAISLAIALGSPRLRGLP
jgi:MFS family permease